MTKEEYKLKTLNSVCTTMQTICDSLICFPTLREKALALHKEIQKEYESVETGPKTESSSLPQTLDLNFVIAYLETSLKKGKQVWCFSPKNDHHVVTCNPNDVKEIILELKSDFNSYNSHLQIEKIGTEAVRFRRELPDKDYERTKCFLITNNSTDVIEIQYY